MIESSADQFVCELLVPLTDGTGIGINGNYEDRPSVPTAEPLTAAA